MLPTGKSKQLVSYEDKHVGRFTEYTYDANGNRQTRSVGGSLMETYILASRNRLTILVQEIGPKTYSYAYD